MSDFKWTPRPPLPIPHGWRKWPQWLTFSRRPGSSRHSKSTCDLPVPADAAYDTIDFMIVLLSYALSGEPTLAAFYDRLAPFSHEVAALFERHRLPSRSALSRFLAALDEPTVEALRTPFLHDRVSASSAFFQSRWIVGSS